MTGTCLSKPIEVNAHPLPWTEGYAVNDARCHNLKHIDATFPKGVFTCVTGVAGSGKSSLACCDFPRQHPAAVVIDQKPIGTSIRSTPATYTGVMDDIREIFAKENGVGPAWFSFNSKGACPACHGKGVIVYEMAFADSLVVPCEECRGKRYNQTALGYTYKGKNIVDVMELTIDEAGGFFESEKVKKKLAGLRDVGLGYLTLGQPTSTLSGGEVQRVKLAGHLQEQGNIYVLDEPSTGLHDLDLEVLYKLFRHLVDQGNTLIVVEHRLELIAKADWIIDMGPGGGVEGGEILFSGTPEQILHCEASKTGRYLKRALKATK